MRMRNALQIVLIGVLGLVLHVSAAEDRRAPSFSSDPSAVKSRLENVRRLVTSSSGARRVIEGSDMAAKSLRNEAELALRTAEKAFAAGQIEQTQEALQQATEKMFSAIRSVGTGKDGVDKQERDFRHKAESVDVLLTAIERIASEKGGRAGVLANARSVRAEVASAQTLADRGDFTRARQQLDESYETAKLELEKLREGETLVRSLSFASPREEYDYEIDRNETHRMLLKVLTSDTEKHAGMQKLIDNYVDRSAVLRRKADHEAGKGAYAEAVRTLEESTRYLQRAIRSAGVYIPG